MRSVDSMANGRSIIVEQASGTQNTRVSNKWMFVICLRLYTGKYPPAMVLQSPSRRKYDNRATRNSKKWERIPLHAFDHTHPFLFPTFMSLFGCWTSFKRLYTSPIHWWLAHAHTYTHTPTVAYLLSKREIDAGVALKTVFHIQTTTVSSVA